MIEGTFLITPSSSHTFADIKSGRWTGVEREFEPALSFCREWLNGQETFTLRTSGSTGRPKQLTVTRQQMAWSAQATRTHLGLREGCLSLCCLNTELVAGRMMLVRAMEWEGSLFLAPPSSVVTSPRYELDIDFAAFVPMQLQASLENPASLSLLNRISHILIGGAPTSPSLRENARALKGNIYQTFGMTETLSHIAMADLKQDGPLVYRTLPGIEINADAESRLVIKSPITPETGIHTQDIVELLDEGSFLWKGRADFVINSGGLKLFPEEIEMQMEPLWRQYYGDVPFFIWKTEHTSLGESVLLVTEGIPETILAESGFLRELQGRLQKYHMPKKILTVERMVMTASSKINKPETVRPYLK